MASVAPNLDHTTAHRYDYKIHPLANLFPELPKDEFEKLKRDIEKNGQIEPIVFSGFFDEVHP